jgi:hypothetical protein
MEDENTTPPLPEETDIFDTLQEQEGPRKDRFLAMLYEINSPLGHDLATLQSYPVCVHALCSAMRILPLRADYTFRMLAFFMRYRMTHVCEIFPIRSSLAYQKFLMCNSAIFTYYP